MVRSWIRWITVTSRFVQSVEYLGNDPSQQLQRFYRPPLVLRGILLQMLRFFRCEDFNACGCIYHVLRGATYVTRSRQRCGDSRGRSDNLLFAKQVLSQLSYIPRNKCGAAE